MNGTVTLSPRKPLGDAVLFVERGVENLDRLIITVHSVRQHWRGPAVLCYFGSAKRHLETICDRYSVHLHYMGENARVAGSDEFAFVNDAMEACPFARILFIPSGSVFLGETPVSEMFALLHDKCDALTCVPTLGVKSANDLQLFRVPFSRADGCQHDSIILCVGDPDTWDETAWEYWCVGYAEAAAAFATNIHVREDAEIIFVVPKDEAGSFQQNWLTFKFPKTASILIFLVDTAATEFWLPGSHSGVSVREITSGEIQNLGSFISILLMSVPRREKYILCPPSTRAADIMNLWVDKAFDDVDIAVIGDNTAVLETKMTGNWFITTPFLAMFSRSSLSGFVEHPIATSTVYEDWPRILRLMAAELDIDIVFSKSVVRQPKNAAGYIYSRDPRGLNVSNRKKSSCLEVRNGVSLADEVLVINLAEREDRRVRVKKMLEDEHVVFRFADGIKIRSDELTREECAEIHWTDVKSAFGRDSYLRGMGGCKRAHLKCLQQAYDDGLNSLMIFEDDAVLVDGWRPILTAAVSELPRGWLQLYLSAAHYRKPSLFSPHLLRITAAFKTTAILFSRDGIEAALQAGLRARNEIDTWWSQHLHPFGASYVVNPHITFQSGGMSSILNINREITC